MKYAFVSAALFAAADALIARDSSCCFHLTASGGKSGVLGQLDDGQNRVGQTCGLATEQATYCLSNGGLTDSNGRGCILTPPTTQFQCDVGAAPTIGFSVNSNGDLTYNGNNQFYACATGDNDGYNIYTTTSDAQTGCVGITLAADNCKVPTPAPAPAPPTTCPAALTGTYEYPHLIIPVDSKQPDKAFGTSQNGTVTSTVSSLYNFDIPSADSGKTCSLVFLFPEQSQLQTSAFDFSGAGGIDFSMLKEPASSGTTYNNRPGIAIDYGVTKVSPGNSYTIATFPCPGNSAIGFGLTASDDTMLSYFQDYNPSPIGLYITVC